ncbi:MAG: hypothetical protein JST15_09235 [Bacteroidetes bacterium]|nr:hypothetical protein [Bacteroidota bacterium]
MEDWKSNIETQIYKESYNGILICGLNWGGVPSNDISCFKENEKKFFSHKMYDEKFRNRILKWFELWDIPIETEEDKIGSFEKSIIYTNWLDSKSKNLDGVDTLNQLKTNYAQILQTIKILTPKIIIFFSKNLMYAINSDEILNQINKILGNNKEIENLQDEEFVKESKLKRFVVLKQELEKCTIYSFPHTRSLVSNQYIKLFKDEMKFCFNEFKENKI